MKSPLSIIALVLFTLAGFSQGKSPSHALFDKLLKAHVNSVGKVDYKGFISDSVALNRYLKTLSNNPPDRKTWTADEQKAFWINAYNAFTIKLIIDNYPVQSIKDLGGKLYKVNTPWDIKFIMVGSEKLDLNNIEHGKLRRDFDDPRVHFALVCASKSCPKLLDEAYQPAKLDEQFNQAGRDFLNDDFRNKISADRVALSAIFKWYKGDFTKNGSLIDFVDQYTAVKINASASIAYLEYDWSLNE
jgi:hypothetical protein